jgi:hypothetical protein
MLDTLAIVRQLTDAGIDREHADAIAAAMASAAEQGDSVSSAEFRAGLAELENRLIKWMLGIVLTVAALQTAILFAALRLPG